jgi:hypothetical protein
MAKSMTTPSSEATASSGRAAVLRPDGLPIGKPFSRGCSGNPAGRPPAAVDIAALAREHGPQCIDVLVELLNDPDKKLRAVVACALLDRGYGRPRQTVEATDAHSVALLHLIAAREVSERLQAELSGQRTPPPVIEGRTALTEAMPARPNGQSNDWIEPALE